MTTPPPADKPPRAPFSPYIPRHVRATTPPPPTPREKHPYAPEPGGDAQKHAGGWLTVAQVAKRLQLEVKYLYTLIRTNRLTATNFGTRMWRVHEHDLRRFIAERHTETQRAEGFDLGLGSGRANGRARIER